MYRLKSPRDLSSLFFQFFLTFSMLLFLPDFLLWDSKLKSSFFLFSFVSLACIRNSVEKFSSTNVSPTLFVYVALTSEHAGPPLLYVLRLIEVSSTPTVQSWVVLSGRVGVGKMCWRYSKNFLSLDLLASRVVSTMAK